MLVSNEFHKIGLVIHMAQSKNIIFFCFMITMAERK